MLNKHQIIACGMTVLNPHQCDLTLKELFPDQVMRRLEVTQALNLYDAYLAITDASLDEAMEPLSMVAFKGFLATELAIPKPESTAIVWAVSDLLQAYEILKKADVEFALSQDEEFDRTTYLNKQRLRDRILCYGSWFPVQSGIGVYVDLSTLDSEMSISSQEFLRDQLARYMKGKDIQIAEMEAQLISSILQGYVARWPGRELGQPLSASDTKSFVADIRAESDRQMRWAGFTRRDAQFNLEYLSNVIRHFFFGAGIFTDPDAMKG